MSFLFICAEAYVERSLPVPDVLEMMEGIGSNLFNLVTANVDPLQSTQKGTSREFSANRTKKYYFQKNHEEFVKGSTREMNFKKKLLFPHYLLLNSPKGLVIYILLTIS